MLGSAAQNIIVLTDNVFLYHQSRLDFASIGLVGVFYLIIASIGYGISRGGQIIIARRYGEYNYEDVGKSFLSLFYIEVAVSIVFFLFLQFGSEPFFRLFIDSPEVLEKCLAYIKPRSWGIFFSYAGVAFVALYTGIARTKFIIYDTLILAFSNLVLNYVLIFGKWGFPEMCISGAAWASTISEIIAFVVFVAYIVWDKSNRIFKIFKSWKHVGNQLIIQVLNIASPIVVQTIVSLGAWFFFFSLVENIGEAELAASNLIRNVYLMLSIPCWGFSAGINTIVSNFIGQAKRQAVDPMIFKTAKACLMVTGIITIPIVLFPFRILYPIFGSADMSIFQEANTLFYVLGVILLIFSIGSIYFHGLAGTGATLYGLKIQVIAAIVYLIYIYLVIEVWHLGLVWAWASEILYWLIIWGFSYRYLKSNRWHKLSV